MGGDSPDNEARPSPWGPGFRRGDGERTHLVHASHSA